MGRLRVAQGRLEDAIPDLERAAQGREPEPLIELAQVYVSLGQPAKAHEAATRALELSPGHPWALSLAGHAPRSLAGQEQEVKGEVYMDIEGVLLKHLIPDELHFDMAVNIFTFGPGTALPMIESHIMEHGLIFLQGGGMYYLGNRWMEVKKDDFIWMGPYCPQSFYPAGKIDSRYIYYKNVNRDLEI